VKMIAAILPRRCRKAKSILTSFPFAQQHWIVATFSGTASVVGGESTHRGTEEYPLNAMSTLCNRQRKPRVLN
jgi:hypothetical protein